MGDVGLDAVVRAINTLNGPVAAEERRAADKWLRRWQMLPEAWEVTLRLLGEPGVTNEVRLTAAIILRTKLLYDFSQLPSATHEAVCSSLLSHIERFKQSSSDSAVLKTLALAFADLSIHTCRSWPTFLDVLHARLSASPEDIPAWLCCLKALPEESSNRVILTDPADQKEHSRLLASRFEWLTAQIVALLHAPGITVTLGLDALECFAEWASFVSSIPEYRVSTLIAPAVSDPCFLLMQSARDDRLIADRIGDCFCQIISIAAKSPAAHAMLLERTLEELAAPGGQLRSMLLAALEADDEETTHQFARIYRYACCGSRKSIAMLLWKREPLVKELLGLFLRLLSVPFDSESECRGVSGIAENAALFWGLFIASVANQREQLNASFASTDNQKHTPSETDVLSHELTSSDRASFMASVAEQDTLFDLLLQTLLHQCELPLDIAHAIHSCPSPNPFYRFRETLLDVIIELRLLYTPKGLLRRVIQSFVASTKTPNFDVTAKQRIVEAHFTCLHRISISLCSGDQSRKWSERDSSANAFDCSASDVETVEFLMISLPSLLSSLSCTPPATVLDCMTRIVAAEMLESMIRKGFVTATTENIQDVIKGLGQQVFHTDLYEDQAGEGTCYGSESLCATKSESDTVTLLEFRRELASVASGALFELCRKDNDSSFASFILQQLYPAFAQSSALHSSVCCSILEGLACTVTRFREDADFLHWSRELLNWCLAALASSQAVPQVCLHLDNLAIVFRGLMQYNSERKKAIGMFLSQQFWPFIEQLWEAKFDSGVVVERCGRVMKHAMRCVGGEVFQDILPSFVFRVVTNAKRELHSTYSYITEWLIAEYEGALDLRLTLTTLFEEISELAIRALQTQSQTAAGMDGNLVEDFFGMFSRALQFCPSIVGNAKVLPEVFTLIYPCLHHPHVTAVQMTCTFFQNAVYCVRTSEVEEGAICQKTEDAAFVSALRILERLLHQHSVNIVKETFLALSALPSSSVLPSLANVITECGKLYRAELKPALEGGLNCLPPAAVAPESYKNLLVRELCEKNAERHFHDLYTRCRRVNLRQREAEATNDEDNSAPLRQN